MTVEEYKQKKFIIREKKSRIENYQYTIDNLNSELAKLM